MSSRELIESLRSAGDEKVRGIRQEAEAEAEKMRAEVAARVERMRAENAQLQSSRAEAVLAAAVNEAEDRARLLRLASEKTLSDRLFSVAVSSLQRLREEGSRYVFEKLAQELPPLAWQTVRVNPEDGELAKNFFPVAEIVPDTSITGGMDATTEGGAIRVVNTFEKRLERAWMDILPGLIKDVYHEVSDGASAEP